MPCDWIEIEHISSETYRESGESATWQYIVFPQCSQLQKRCCFLCGVFCKQKHHNVLFEEVEDMLSQQDSGDILQQTYTNLLMSSEALHTQMNSRLYTLGLCAFCYSWMGRKKKSKRSGSLFPIQLLRRHINTLSKYRKRYFDSRILWYLCKSLCQKSNDVGVNLFYLALLEHEQDVVREIYCTGKHSIKYVLAKHYRRNNRGAIFCQSISIAQFLRENLQRETAQKQEIV